MKSQKVSDTETKTHSKKSGGPSNSYENYDTQLNEWSQKLAEFKDKITLLGLDLQSEATEKYKDLEKKYSETAKKMAELKGKGLIAKDEMKTGFEKAWKDLLQAFDAAKKTFH